MKTQSLGLLMLLYVLPVFAESNTCTLAPVGYRVVVNSLFPFSVDGKKACFFAFYTTNPYPEIDLHGTGNPGDAIWYGYYELRNPDKIYEFPKPSDTRWSMVCCVDAVSFWDMNDDKKPDVTVIGSCDKNAINYSVPLVFIRSGGKYILDKDVYNDLYGFIALTVSDVRAYIKSSYSGSYFQLLRDRYQLYK